jgi:adenosylcobinamide-GDP ribazoletransferase
MGFIAALHFLTALPVAPRRMFADAELGASLAYYPVVGAVLGVLLALAALAAQWLFAGGVGAALTLLAWVLLTGGLHYDGLMDACDGLLSHRATEERLRIMRDVHVGAWGVLGGGLALLIQFAVLSQLFALPVERWLAALLLAPVLARWALSLAVVAFPYGREAGWGLTLKQNAGRRQLLLATIATLVLVTVVQVWLGLAAWLAVMVAIMLLVRFALDRLPGLTGDVYGLLAVAAETVVLLVFAARWG